MKKELVVLSAALWLTSQTPAMAEEVIPGLWELSLETRVDTAPGFVPPPFFLRQCFKAADARNPSRILGLIANPGASDCIYREKTYVGNVFRFAMQCAGSFKVSATGEVRFGAKDLAGTINATAMVLGSHTEVRNQLRGRRVGDC